MKRDEMINYLESRQRAYTWITVLTSEGPALECSVACAKGASELGWIAMDEWPVYRFSVPTSFNWSNVLFKIKNGDLTCEDIRGTGLFTFCKAMHGRAHDEETEMTSRWLCSLLSPLMHTNVDQSCNKLWALLSGEEMGKTRYYTREDLLEAAFLAMHDFQSWSDMSDDQLEYWYEKIKDGDDGEGVFAYDLDE